MKSISPALKAHLKQQTTTVTTCWKITRMDGQVFAYTELDRDVTYAGVTYRSAGGFNRSAMQNSGTLAVDGMEVSGFLSDDTIPDLELRNGAFDYAQVEIFLINYMDHSMGELKLRWGYFGEVRSAPSGMFLVELRGLVQMLAQTVGEVYTPECRADLGDAKCKVNLTPPLWIGGRHHAAGTRIIAPVNSVATIPPVDIGIVNGGFEDGDGLTGWQLSFAQTSQGTLNVQPRAGSTRFLRMNDVTSGLRQTRNLEIGAADAPAISTGKLKLRFRAWIAPIETGQVFGIRAVFRTGLNGGGISALDLVKDTGLLKVLHGWRQVEINFDIPHNARSVTFYLYSWTDAVNTVRDLACDDVEAQIVFEEVREGYEIYGGVEFECTTAGTTGTAMPSFDTTIGNTTVDGSAVWTARTPVHMFVDTVASDATTSNILIASTLDKPDGWFDWGVLRMLSGANQGRAVEVISWNNATKQMTLAMPLPYQTEAGDIFQIHTGCDKSRAVCRDKFANILNFRGEPDIPGNGQYFNVAGVRR